MFLCFSTNSEICLLIWGLPPVSKNSFSSFLYCLIIFNFSTAAFFDSSFNNLCDVGSVGLINCWILFLNISLFFAVVFNENLGSKNLSITSSPTFFIAVSNSFTELLAANFVESFNLLKNCLTSKVDFSKNPSGLSPYSGPYLWTSCPIEVLANWSKGSTSTPLNFCIPLPAPIKAKLNNAPSVPNFNLFFNFLKASALPSLSSRSNIVTA